MKITPIFGLLSCLGAFAEAQGRGNGNGNNEDGNNNGNGGNNEKADQVRLRNCIKQNAGNIENCDIEEITGIDEDVLDFDIDGVSIRCQRSSERGNGNGRPNNNNNGSLNNNGNGRGNGQNTRQKSW